MARPSSGSRPGRRSSRGARTESDPRQRWLTTYADAVTLLMAFFVLLYAMSEVDVVKFSAFVEGLRVPFGNEAGEGLLPASDGLQPEDTPTPPAAHRPEDPDREESTQPNPPPPDAWSEADREAVAQHAGAQDQLDGVAEALRSSIQEHGLDQYVELRREERGLVVSIASDDVLFALGSTHIDERGLDVIRVVSQTLDGYPNPLFIEGHTDDLHLDRDGYTNWNLSTDRAVAVLKRMIEEHGLPSDRVGAVGYGEYHPLDTNETAAGRARNRRVDIVVLLEEIA